MAIQPGTLAAGTLPTSQTAIFTAGGYTFITAIYLTNRNAATQTIRFWIKRSGGTAREIRPIELAQDESYVFDERLELSSGDEIEAITTTGSAVDFTIVGGLQI